MSVDLSRAELEALGYTVHDDGRVTRARARPSGPTAPRVPESGLPWTYLGPQTCDAPTADPGGEQKRVWQLLTAAGCIVYWFSQRRRSGQTKGIPDLGGFLPARLGMSGWFWFEDKVEGERVRPDQLAFANYCRRNQVPYAIGDRRACVDFLVELGLGTYDTTEPEGIRLLSAAPGPAEESQDDIGAPGGVPLILTHLTAR